MEIEYSWRFFQAILVPQDVAERVVGDDGDRVLLEVVS
jgi:hypothetical protein